MGTNTPEKVLNFTGPSGGGGFRIPQGAVTWSPGEGAVELDYREIFEEMPCFLSVQDRDFKIVKTNARFRKYFGEFEGRYCFQVYKHRSERCEICPVARTFPILPSR